MKNPFSEEITYFKDRKAPEKGILVGYSLLIEHIYEETKRAVPLPQKLAIATEKQQRYDTEKWRVFSKRHKPKNDLISHIAFALKYEGLDLYVLKETFKLIGPGPVAEFVEREPTGMYSRRVWFLYEWLLDERIDIPDQDAGTYAKVIDPRLQYEGPVRNSTRHRVKNNLPGTREYCPLIFKTEKLEDFRKKSLSEAIEKNLKNKDRNLIRRTAAFLLLKDSKASFEIEGEHPPEKRARNWGRTIGKAGKQKLDVEELERLQDLVIGTNKLKHMGIRINEEGFIGEHDRKTFDPIPDHISAKASDLRSLMNGLIETNELLTESDYDAVLMAAAIAFGFVFIHPFSDGNGRIHRYLIHHILRSKGYTKRDMIFPISASILGKIAGYQEVLEDFSEPRLDLIEWEPDRNHNVKILNETADLYRYPDLTKQAEFLYECVEDTIDNIIPNELGYLAKYDQLFDSINSIVTLPNTKVDLLIKLLDQNKGTLSKRKRESMFEEIAEADLAEIQSIYCKVFFEKE